MRFEKVADKRWKYTWAFPIKDSAAKREGYDATLIDGMIEPDKDYPGCPYCGKRSFVVCECGKLNCNISNGDLFTCEWCGLDGNLVGYDGSGIQSAGDR